MDSSNDLIRLSELDGHGMYERFEIIRSIICQAMGTDNPEEIHKHYSEILLNMMLLKISLYMDRHTDSLHFYNDYQMFLAYIKDATDYITERYKETGASGFGEADTIDLIYQHYREYMKQHDPA